MRQGGLRGWAYNGAMPHRTYIDSNMIFVLTLRTVLFIVFFLHSKKCLYCSNSNGIYYKLDLKKSIPSSTREQKAISISMSRDPALLASGSIMLQRLVLQAILLCWLPQVM
ncbi:hypothetical protein BYT27DRAFT_6736165 [Phlegmacium glaucopus]|nr:hypothetical protein BYT27DRAFT_6736165 [Phlegmacium glaucopus]